MRFRGLRVRSSVLAGLGLALIVSTGCESAATTPVVPTAVQAPTPAPGPGAVFAPSWPAVDRPARVYVGTPAPASPLHGSALHSRFVLYDDLKFGLQYASQNLPFFEYRGTYVETGGHINFTWEGWSLAGPWGATATATEDRLDVFYNLVMQMSDFVDGIYLRQR